MWQERGKEGSGEEGVWVGAKVGVDFVLTPSSSELMKPPPQSQKQARGVE